MTLNIAHRHLKAHGYDQLGRPTTVEDSGIYGTPVPILDPDGTRVGDLRPGGRIAWKGHHSPNRREVDALYASEDALRKERRLDLVLIDGKPVRAFIPGLPSDDT